MLYANFKFRRAFHDAVCCAKFRSFQSLLFFACFARTEVPFLGLSCNSTLVKETRIVDSIEIKNL